MTKAKHRGYQGSTPIFCGFAKGFKVLLDSNQITRPTKNIVKKSLFDTISQDLKNISFVECFCGSGQIGLQALSMGAKESIFFEKDPGSFYNLSLNIKNFKVRFGDQNLHSYNMDFFNSLEILSSIKNRVILYIDPPFNIRDGYEYIYRDINDFVHSFDIKMTRKIDIIISEIPSSIAIDSIGDFKLYKLKKFGNTTLAYFKIPEENK